MNNKAMVAVIIVLVVIVAGLVAWYLLQAEETVTPTNNSVTTTTTQKDLPAENTVWIQDGSFTPSVVTISAGETITWVNKDAINRQVASDPHPAHTGLPGLESEELAQDESYTYTFDTVGEWSYHDHLNPIKKGVIIVE